MLGGEPRGAASENWEEMRLMWDWLTMPTVQAVLGIVILSMMIAAGFWLVSIYRDRATQDTLEPFDPLTNFEEMLREGDISEFEFRTIKASMERHQSTDAAQDDSSGEDGREDTPGD